MSISVPHWTMSQSSCGTLTYTAKLQNGGSLPTFIKFSATAASFSVMSFGPSDAKSYSITVKGEMTDYDKLASSISSTFTLNVACVPAKLISGTKTGSYSFTLGGATPLAITFKDFTLMPACSGISPSYTASLANGKPLPS